MRHKWKGIIRQSSKGTQFVKILDTNEKKGDWSWLFCKPWKQWDTGRWEENGKWKCLWGSDGGWRVAVDNSLCQNAPLHKRLISESETASKSRDFFSSLKRSLETTACTALANQRGAAVWFFNINTCLSLRGLICFISTYFWYLVINSVSTGLLLRRERVEKTIAGPFVFILHYNLSDGCRHMIRSDLLLFFANNSSSASQTRSRLPFLISLQKSVTIPGRALSGFSVSQMT